MFNIFEGNANAKALKLRKRLRILRRAYESGIFGEEPAEEQPEIVADGHGPDDGWLKETAPELLEHGERCPNPGGNAATLSPTPKPQETTFIWCHDCDVQTNHNSYGRGSPTWHCSICCTCDWCMANLERERQSNIIATKHGMAKIERAREALERAMHEAPEEQLFFCTKCGAGLRCGVCNNTGTGRYCDLCGRKDTGEGLCTDCWKKTDLDG